MTSNGQTYRLTWLAIVLCILLVLPGNFLAHLAWKFSAFFVADAFEQSWLPRWLLDAMVWALRGGLAGTFAMSVTGYVFRRSNLELVAYAAGAVWVAVLVVLTLFPLMVRGSLPDGTLAGVAQTIGVVAGQFAGLAVVRQMRPA
ncbi:MAG: hypothetical protein GC190_18030 [Alphaproteobacteria bacterium]|nr:hypothetical protein [Alphaproteobacteria bacterium]